MRTSTLLVIAAIAAAGCSDAASDGATCAHVIDAVATRSGEQWTFAVSVRSADTGWEQYADGWEVLDGDGAVLGTRILAHPHVDEQPFTRSLSGVTIPDDIGEVRIRARDSVGGFCGDEFVLELPR